MGELNKVIGKCYITYKDENGVEHKEEFFGVKRLVVDFKRPKRFIKLRIFLCKNTMRLYGFILLTLGRKTIKYFNLVKIANFFGLEDNFQVKVS